MFPLWEVAVAPVLEAAGARKIVEIGALRGENTRQIIERLGPETVLHVIDPLPDFDPAEHEAEFAGQYVFHRNLSLDVLGDLPPMDAALVDGDHNWYTVYNELRLLREVARANDAPLPLLILHDVGWPYGRRDLYYDPTNIPDEFRREWSRKGMEPGKVWVVPYGAGLNPTLANANTEGGRRNGVRTGMDDFVAEHDQPLRVVVLPIYFGLAIVAEESRLDANPALRAALDRLESPEGKDALLQVAEDIRIDHLIFQHKVYYDREAAVGRVARRYLGQVGQADLVLEVVLVHQAAHHAVEVALGEPLDGGLVLEVDPVLEDHGLDAHGLGQLQQEVLALGALQVVEHGGQLGLAGQAGLLHHDGQPEVDGQHHLAQRLGPLGHEVVERGAHTVAGAALGAGVGHGGVEPTPAHQARVAGPHALVSPRLAMLGGHVVGVVVEVAPAVGPAHVVQHQHRERCPVLVGHLPEQAQLVDHRVPVVVAVDEGGVHGGQPAEHVEAQGPVEHVLLAEAGPVLVGVELGHRVDHVQLGPRAEPVEDQLRLLAAECADLHEALDPRGLQDRRHHLLPEREHPGHPTPRTTP